MKKVLHIFSEINYSGAELMWHSAIDILKENNYELILISTGETKGDFAFAFEERGVKVYHIPTDNKIIFLINIFNIIKNIKPDVLHIHPEYKHFYTYYTLFATLVGAKVLRTIHSMQKSRFKNYGKLMRKLSKILGCKFVSVSKDVQKNELNLYQNKTYFIHNWADNSRFKLDINNKNILRKKLNLPSEKTLIVSVGSCYYIKNHDLILNTMPLLDDKHIYIHIGTGVDEEKEKFLAKKLSIEDRVYFLGTKKNIEEYLQACDIYVMPSLYEGAGIAAIEAIMSGIKVILTNVDGLNAMDKYKPLVQYIENNTNDLKNKIENFEEIDIKKIEKIRNKVVEMYGVQQGVKEYLKLYEC